MEKRDHRHWSLCGPSAWGYRPRSPAESSISGVSTGELERRLRAICGISTRRFRHSRCNTAGKCLHASSVLHDTRGGGRANHTPRANAVAPSCGTQFNGYRLSREMAFRRNMRCITRKMLLLLAGTQISQQPHELKQMSNQFPAKNWRHWSRPAADCRSKYESHAEEWTVSYAFSRSLLGGFGQCSRSQRSSMSANQGRGYTTMASMNTYTRRWTISAISCSLDWPPYASSAWLSS